MVGRRACYVRYQLGKGGYKDQARWPEIQDDLIDAMRRQQARYRARITPCQGWRAYEIIGTRFLLSCQTSSADRPGTLKLQTPYQRIVW